MITRLYASNYRSIGEGLDLRLGPLTVLVGPNGSGKSNVIDVFQFLHDCVERSPSEAIATRQGFRSLRRWSASKPHKIDVAAEIHPLQNDDEVGGFWGFTLSAGAEEDDFIVEREYAYSRGLCDYFMGDAGSKISLDAFLRSPDGTGLPEAAFTVLRDQLHAFFRTSKGWTFPTSHSIHTNPSHYTGPMDLYFPFADYVSGVGRLGQLLKRIAIYSLFPNTLRAAQNPNPVKPMLSSGDNWASTLKALNKKEWGAELCTALKKITGDIDDYRVVQAGGYVIPEFRHGKGKGKGVWRGAAQESDGTLRIAAMLTALFQEPAPSLIGFEEPELAVHPGALPILYDYLVEASERSQIVITTHSPELMDLFDVDCIRVVERKNGVTTVGPIEERQRELVRKRLFSTSELLYSEGLRPEGTANDE